MQRKNRKRTTKHMEENPNTPPCSILFLPGMGGDADLYLPIIRELHLAGFHFHPTFFKYDAAQYVTQCQSVHDANSLRHLDHQQGRDEVASSPETNRFLYDFVETQLRSNRLIDIKFDLVIGYSFGSVIGRIGLENGWIKGQIFCSIASGASGKQLTRLGQLAVVSLPLVPRFMRRSLMIFIAFVYPFVRAFRPFTLITARMVTRFPADIFFELPRTILGWSGPTMALGPPEAASESRPRADRINLKKSAAAANANESKNANKIPAFVEKLPVSAILTIIGNADPLFDSDKIKTHEGVDLLIPGGSHTIFATAARAIADFIRQRSQELIGRG